MKSPKKYIDIVVFLLLIVVCIMMFVVVYTSQLTVDIYVMVAMIFFIIGIGYFSSLLAVLTISAFFIFIYGSYVIYSVLDNPAGTYSFWWIVSIPIVGILAAKLGEYARNITKEYVKFADLVMIDEDTGFRNTRLFENDLQHEMSRAKRYDFDLSLMIIKIEFFKSIIRTYGIKVTADIVLHVVEELKKTTRLEDKKYRLKEDEFVVIMPNTSLLGAENVKKRIKNNILKFTINEKEEIVLSVRIGIHEYSKNINDVSDFTQKAERELDFDV